MSAAVRSRWVTTGAVSESDGLPLYIAFLACPCVGGCLMVRTIFGSGVRIRGQHVTVFAVLGLVALTPTPTTLADETNYTTETDFMSFVGKAPGLPESGIFSGFENGESVSLYNGNLSILHASSPTYSLDGGGSIGLVRSFNSKRVRRDLVQIAQQPNTVVGGCDPIYGPHHYLHGRGWIGMGWTMHLGRVLKTQNWHDACSGYGTDKVLFEDSVGTQHQVSPYVVDAHPVLSATFHPEENAERCLDGTAYCGGGDCCDGSHPGGCSFCSCDCDTEIVQLNPPRWIVIYPDGTKYTLEEIVQEERNPMGWLSNGDRAGFYTTKIEDVHGNVTTVEYWGSANPEYPEAIRYVRVQREPESSPRVVIETIPWSTADATNNDCPVAAVGTLKTLRALTSLGQWVEYRFVYEVRGAYDPVDQKTDRPVLSEVHVGQAALSDPVATVRYEYLDSATNPFPANLRVARVNYPGGGVSEYEYGPFTLGYRSSCPDNPLRDPDRDCPYLRPKREVGVTTRTVYPDGIPESGTPAKSEWTWHREFYVGEGGAADPEFINDFVITAPDGSQRKATFGGHPADDGPAADLLYGWEMSSEALSGPDASGTRRAVRKSEVGYHHLGNDLSDRIAKEVMKSYERTVFSDDEGACFQSPGELGDAGTRSTTTTWHQRDDQNHWRLTLTGSVDYLEHNTQAADGTMVGRRLSYTAYENPLSTTHAAKHVLNTYTFTFAQEGDQRIESTYSFDALGRLDWARAKRDLRTVSGPCLQPEVPPYPPTPQNWDNWVVCDPDPATEGDVTHDLAWSAAGNLQSIDFTGGDPYTAGGPTRSYRVDYTWDHGRAESVTIQGLAYPSRRIDVDAAGFVGWSEDPNGLRTTYAFDSVGRLTTIDPPGSVEHTTRLVYPSLSEARIIQSAGFETDHVSGDPGQVFAKQLYDGLGRLVESWKAIPEGELAFQFTRYDAMGRVIFKSEWLPGDQYSTIMAETVLWEGPDGSDTDSAPDYFVRVPVKDGRPWGTVTFFGVPNSSDPGDPLQATADALGRVRRVELADGSSSDTRYCGPHKEVIVHRSSASGADPMLPDVKTRSFYDGLGRLALVDVEPFAGATGPYVGADAEYRYDVLGNLIKVNLVENLPADAFQAWVTKDPGFPQGQIRTFEYDGLGRLREACNPENGCTETTAYDVWGKPLVSQDALSASRTGGFSHFENEYDAAGRLIRAKKIGSGITKLSGHGDFNETADVGGSAWQLGTLSEDWNNFIPGDAGWGRTEYSTLTCLPPPPGEASGGAGLKLGAGCSYSEVGSSPQAARHFIERVGRSNVISISYWREVRQGSGSNRDDFELLVVLDDGSQGTSTALRRRVFRLDDSQASTSRWERTAQVRLSDLFSPTEWPLNEEKDAFVYIVFDKGDNSATGLGIGIVVDDVFVGGNGTETLAEFVYDQPVCPDAGDACASLEESTEYFRGNLTRQLSHQDGRLVEAKDLVYKGMNGRLSGTRRVIDLTGHDEDHEWVTRWQYGPTGLVTAWDAPYLPSTEYVRRYGYAYDRGLLTGLRVGSQTYTDFIGFGGSQIRYDISGALVGLPFANHVSTEIAVDKLGRPTSYSVQRDGGGSLYWSSGAYRFDGAGNIVGIGDQSFEYDNVGRLTQARVRNQAYPGGSGNFFVETYSFDVFGNMTNKDWQEENAAVQNPPLGAEFDHGFGASPNTNANQIVDAGFRYDLNGNMVRFLGSNQGPVAGLWTSQNRMAAYYRDPESPNGMPVERYTYDSSGYRVLRFPEAGDGLRVVTLRDATGQPLAEYVDSPDGDHPNHSKDFVHGAGMLLMERWKDGSAPSATNTSPMAANGSVGLSVSAADPIETWAVDVRPEGGGASLVPGLEVEAEGKIWLPESSLAPDVTNYLRVRRDDGEVGAYSNAVTVAYDPDVNAQSANQVRAVSVSRSGTDVQVRWQLFQANGKALRLYYERADGGGTLLLTPAGLAAGTTTFMIQNQSLTVECGYFYLTQQISGPSWTGPSPSSGLPPAASSMDFGANQNCDQEPPPPPPSGPTWVNTFHHRDHLGSLRIVTDAAGWKVGDGHDYYPFGMEMVPGGTDTRGGSRKRFTGHERDEASGLDYMFARYATSSLANFLSVDPAGASLSAPQSWNKYAYVRGSPVLLWDPDGRRIAISTTGKKYDTVRNMLVESAMRPGGREQLRQLAASTKLYTYTDYSFPKNARKLWDLRRGVSKNEKLTFGETVPTAEGATIRLDTDTIKDRHQDKSGVTTVVHENVHALGVDAGLTKDEISTRDHDPDSERGAAEQAGRLVAAEAPTSRAEAEAYVDRLLREGQQSTQRDPNFPTNGPNSKATPAPCRVNPAPGSGETTCRIGGH